MLNPKENAALDLLENKPEYADYFFGKVKNSRFFSILIEKGYFSESKAPSPVSAGKEGFFSIPQWNVLPYLESIAQCAGPQYKDDLLRIILAVTKKRVEILKATPDSMELDNYRTWFSFAKIIGYLPKEAISREVVDCFEVWLASTFDTTLTSLEILKNVLPKYLGENPSASDIEMAEQITAILVRVKEIEKKERTLLVNRKKFAFIADDYWLSETYLSKKMAAKLGQKCSEGFIWKLADDLRKLVGQSGISWFPVESAGHEYLFTVERVDAGLIYELREREKPKQEDFLYDLSKFAEYLPKTSPITPGSAKEFTEAVSAWMKKHNVPEPILLAISDKLEKFYRHLWDDSSYSWCPSLAETSTHTHRDAEATFLQIFRDVLEAKAKSDPAMARRIFDKLLNSNSYLFPVFTRVVLYCYSNGYNEYRKDFWDFVSSRKYLFEKRDFEAEVYDLLQSNLNKFSKEERAILNGIIGGGPISLKYNESQKIYWRQRWYSALTEDQEYASLYKDCFAATKTKEHFNFRDSHVRVGYGPSPLSKEDILGNTNASLAKFISEFEAKPRKSWDDPNPEALAGIIRQIAAESPEKFTKDLLPFRDTGYQYLYEMLWGFWDYLNKSRGPFDWDRTLTFIETYVNRDEFWADKFVSKAESGGGDAKHDWIVNVLVELLQIGVKGDDVRAVPGNLTDKVERLVDLIFNRMISRPPVEDDEKDPVSKTLNSNTGKLATTLLYLSLRIARLQGDSGAAIKWKPELKKTYEVMLAGNVVEPYAVLGEYLANFLYLDKDWTETKIAESLKLPNHLWEAFVSGFFCTSAVYDDYFGLMSPHYLKAIGHSFNSQNVQESLAQHIAIFYMRGLDNFGKDGLLDKLIHTNNSVQMNRLIGFLWMQRADAPQEKSKAVVSVYKDGDVKHEEIDLSTNTGREQYGASINKRIVSLWGHLAQHYKSIEVKTDADNQNIASLAELAVFLPQLDKDSVDWIKISLPFLKPWGACIFLLEYLNRLKTAGDAKQSAAYIADIMLELTANLLPDYKQEDIAALLSFLFVNGQAEAARAICDRYGKGHREDVIKEVYEQYGRA